MSKPKLEQTMMRTTRGGYETQVPRCQGINTSDWRSGRQCGNAVRVVGGYCHLHRPTATMTIEPDTFELKDAEVCVQFDDDEPTVIFDGGSRARGPFVLEIRPPFTDGGSQVSFDDGRGKRFRLFVRRRR